MSLHIGIVACSAEGAALCYRAICMEGARFFGPHRHPEVTLHSQSLAKYVACLDRGDLEGRRAHACIGPEARGDRGRFPGQWLVDSEVYPEKLAAHGIECVRPAPAKNLKRQGCEAVILGCTGISLIIDETNSALPTFDSTRLLALAALQRAHASD